MKRLFAILLSLSILLTMVGCGEPDVVADYASVQDAITAARSGVDLTGKTVRVDMNQDSVGGIIYNMPDTSINANINVVIITNDNNRDEVLGLKQGDTVVVTVDNYDDHLKYSIYFYALDYTIY